MHEIHIITENNSEGDNQVSKLMTDHGVEVKKIKVKNLGSSNIISLTVNKHESDLAHKKLTEASFKAVSNDTLLIKMKDEPGALAMIARKFKLANVDSRSFHIIKRDGDNTIAAISTRSLDEARKLLKDVLI